MKTRVLSGLVYGAAMIFMIIKGGLWLLLWMFFVALVGFYEVARATGVLKEKEKLNLPVAFGFIGLTVYYFLLYMNYDMTYLILTIILTMVAIMAAFVFSFPKFNGQQIINCVFALIYAPVTLSFLYTTREFCSQYDTDRFGIGFFAVWLILIAAWFTDMGAYFVGVLIGKHKIAPNLSPKKTIEGCVGGVLIAGLGGFILGYIIYAREILTTIDTRLIFALLSMCGSICAQVGDLAASGIKRHFGIKDYGKIIPGHGGVCDRFDSVIFTCPMIYLLTLIFLK